LAITSLFGHPFEWQSGGCVDVQKSVDAYLLIIPKSYSAMVKLLRFFVIGLRQTPLRHTQTTTMQSRTFLAEITEAN